MKRKYNSEGTIQKIMEKGTIEAINSMTTEAKKKQVIVKSKNKIVGEY